MPLFSKIAVEFVPEGMTAEEARQQRAKDRANRRMSNRDVLMGVGAIIGLVAMVAVPWLWWQSGRVARADGAGVRNTQPATMIAYESSTIPTETPAPTASPTPTETPTNHPQSRKVLLYDFVSPINTPRPDHPDAPAPTATATQTATATPTPTETPKPPYEILYHAVWPEENPGASYHISGWVVEADGKTPRPVGMELCYADGCLQWPRPGAADVANGFYEFLVSPGYWTLKVKDTDGIDFGFQVYPDGPARYEVSFRFNGSRTIAPARSNPWDVRYPTPVGSGPTSPVATPTPVQKNNHIYLPVVVK